MSLNNIGFIYDNQRQAEKALEYYHKSLDIQEEIQNKHGIATSLGNIGSVHKSNGQKEKALEYYQKALAVQEEIQDKKGGARSLNNMGSIYDLQGQTEKALEYYRRALAIQEELQDKRGITYSLNNLGAVYLKVKDFVRAEDYALHSLQMAKEGHYVENIRNAEELLSKIYKTQGKGMLALEHYENYITYRDSINNLETQKASIRQQEKYLYEKEKAVADASHNADMEKQATLAAAEKKKQNIIILAVAGGLLLVLVFTVFIFNRFRLTKRQKKIIEEQKIEVEEKQKEILDSIRYAKRIQTALLTNTKYISKKLNELN